MPAPPTTCWTGWPTPALVLRSGSASPKPWSTSSALPASTWQPAYNADGEPRPGAWVIEATGLMSLSGWPKGMRVIVRKERPHPGAQLRLSDPDGHRYTAFATNTAPGGPGRQLADLELRHGPRTGRGPHPRRERTPGCATCPCTHSTRTGSGKPSSRWPATSPPGPRCSRSLSTQRGGGSPKRLRLRIFSPTRRPGPSRPHHRAAPARPRTLDPARPRRPRPAPRARRPRLTASSTVPTHQEPDRPVEPAHPSDLGRTVTPTRQNRPSTPDQNPVKITTSNPTKDPG